MSFYDLIDFALVSDVLVIVSNVRNEKGNYGYDARTSRYVNMFEAGIIDPAKVSRFAL